MSIGKLPVDRTSEPGTEILMVNRPVCQGLVKNPAVIGPLASMAFTHATATPSTDLEWVAIHGITCLMVLIKSTDAGLQLQVVSEWSNTRLVILNMPLEQVCFQEANLCG